MMYNYRCHCNNISQYFAHFQNRVCINSANLDETFKFDHRTRPAKTEYIYNKSKWLISTMEPLNNTEPQTYDNFEKDKKKWIEEATKLYINII